MSNSNQKKNVLRPILALLGLGVGLAVMFWIQPVHPKWLGCVMSGFYLIGVLCDRRKWDLAVLPLAGLVTAVAFVGDVQQFAFIAGALAAFIALVGLSLSVAQVLGMFG